MLKMVRTSIFIFCFISIFVFIFLFTNLGSIDYIYRINMLEVEIYNGYCVNSNIFNNVFNEEERITQILHLSSNFVDERLVEQVRNWNAPVSATIVLLKESDFHCVKKKILGYLNDTIVSKYLKIHFIFRREWSETCSSEMFPKAGNCSLEQSTVKEIAEYPANIARNVARIHSSTNYILIADYEHLFNRGFEKSVLEIAKSTLTENRILIYRIFEISENSTEPEDKNQLKEMIDSGEAVVFHEKFYKGAHGIPRLAEWFAENSSATGIFMENVKYRRYDWEPQFVSRRDIPLHDVNFPFLIRDNTVLRWELCRAGYQFDILSDHFMYHKGIKTSKSSSVSKQVQHLNSQKFYKALALFNQRMDAEYPETKNRCPTFGA